MTLSTSEKTGDEHFFRQEEQRLARVPRRHAKKRKGSKNRENARRKVARLHAGIADRRRDFQQKLTTRLIRDNQVTYVESLAVKNLLQIHHLAKSIADGGWDELLRQLEYTNVFACQEALPRGQAHYPFTVADLCQVGSQPQSFQLLGRMSIARQNRQDKIDPLSVGPL